MVVGKFIIMICTFLAVACGAVEHDVCRSNRGLRWKPHPEDCAIFFLCFNEQPFRYSCPVGSVRDFISKACVPKGSEADQCSNVIQKEIMCALDERRKSIPGKSCAKYMDCDALRAANGRQVEAVRECEYPLVFDENTKRCEHPDVAECGDRHVPKDPCDYDVNHCQGPHCTPCYIRFPSCVGYADGMNPWKGREKSPYYVVCKNERVLYQGECPKGRDFIQVFDPDQKVCVDYTKLARD